MVSASRKASIMSLTTSVLGAAALILSSTLPSVAFGPKGEFTGHWEGTIVREGVPLEVSFDFKGSEPTSKRHVHFLNSKGYGLSARQAYREREMRSTLPWVIRCCLMAN